MAMIERAKLGNASRADQTRAGSAAVVALRMPDIVHIRNRMLAIHPLASVLYVNPEGKAFVFAEEATGAMARDHVAWMVGTYGGRDGLPALAELRDDVEHHLTTMQGD